MQKADSALDASNELNHEKEDSFEGTNQISRRNESLVDHTSSSRDTDNVSVSNDADKNLPKFSSDQENQAFHTGNDVSSVGLELPSIYKCTSFGPNNATTAYSHGTPSMKSDVYDSHENIIVELPSNSATQKLEDLSNDFSSTFMLDEELELEHKTVNKRLSTTGRYYMLSHVVNEVLFFGLFDPSSFPLCYTCTT